MKLNASCPVTDKKADENVVRINAAFTVLILIILGFTHNIFLLLFLAIDFFLRAIDHAKYSPLAISSNFMANLLIDNKNLINAGPKLLAARIGLIFCCIIFISLLFSLKWLVIAVARILGLFSLLESAFGICVACKIYPYLYQYIYRQ